MCVGAKKHMEKKKCVRREPPTKTRKEKICQREHTHGGEEYVRRGPKQSHGEQFVRASKHMEEKVL